MTFGVNHTLSISYLVTFFSGLKKVSPFVPLFDKLRIHFCYAIFLIKIVGE